MLRAVGDIILVQELEEEEKPGIIIVPGNNTTEFRAKVLSVGDTVKINVKEGDIVLLTSYARSSKLRDHGCLYITSGSVLAVEE